MRISRGPAWARSGCVVGGSALSALEKQTAERDEHTRGVIRPPATQERPGNLAQQPPGRRMATARHERDRVSRPPAQILNLTVVRRDPSQQLAGARREARPRLAKRHRVAAGHLEQDVPAGRAGRRLQQRACGVGTRDVWRGDEQQRASAERLTTQCGPGEVRPNAQHDEPARLSLAGDTANEPRAIGFGACMDVEMPGLAIASVIERIEDAAEGVGFCTPYVANG